MCPGNSLVGNDEPEEGGDIWDPSADKGGGRGTQLSGVPGGFLAQNYQVLAEFQQSVSSWQPTCALRERRIGSFLTGSLLQHSFRP